MTLRRDLQIVVMGVMGAGKTTIGRALAERLGCAFFDADDLHSDDNRSRLAAGVALTDEDRGPWVEQVAQLIAALHARGETGVIACSALTGAIRSRLAAASEGVVFIHLHSSRTTIGERLQQRQDHFADPSLLDSQYATLELPEDAISVDASGTPEAIVDQLVAELMTH